MKGALVLCTWRRGDLKLKRSGIFHPATDEIKLSVFLWASVVYRARRTGWWTASWYGFSFLFVLTKALWIWEALEIISNTTLIDGCSMDFTIDNAAILWFYLVKPVNGRSLFSFHLFPIRLGRLVSKFRMPHFSVKEVIHFKTVQGILSARSDH